MKQHAVLRATQEVECRELQEAIECRNERHKRLMSMMERKQNLLRDVPEFHKNKILGRQISAKELDLLEKKQAMKELWKRRKNELEGWRDTVVVGGEVAWMAAAWSRHSEAEGDLLVSEVGVLQRDSEEDQRSFCQAEAPPQKRRAAKRVESAEAQDCVSPPPLTRGTEQKMEVEDEKNMEELCFASSAVSEPRWALRKCDNKCRAKGFKFSNIAAIVSEVGGAAHAIHLCKKCCNEGRLKQGEAEVNGATWRAIIEQKSSRAKLWAAFGVDQLLRSMWERFAIENAWTRSVLSDADNVRQNGTDGRRQHEPPYKEELDLLRHCTDLRFGSALTSQAYDVVKSGGWPNCW